MKSHFDYPEIYNPDGTSTKLGRILSMIAKNDSIEIPRKDVEGLIKLRFITYGLHPRGGYRASITQKGRKALTLADGHKVADSFSDRQMSASRVSGGNPHFEREIQRIDAAIDTLRAASISSDVNMMPMAEELREALVKEAERVFPVVASMIYSFGGKHRPSVGLTVSAQPRDDWKGGILENSDYAKVSFNLDSTDRKGFSMYYNSGHGLPKMRLTRFSDVDSAVKKFVKWARTAISSESVGKRSMSKAGNLSDFTKFRVNYGNGQVTKSFRRLKDAESELKRQESDGGTYFIEGYYPEAYEWMQIPRGRKRA